MCEACLLLHIAEFSASTSRCLGRRKMSRFTTTVAWRKISSIVSSLPLSTEPTGVRTKPTTRVNGSCRRNGGVTTYYSAIVSQRACGVFAAGRRPAQKASPPPATKLTLPSPQIPRFLSPESVRDPSLRRCLVTPL